MLKILGFFVGALFTVWAFNKFVPSDTREEILDTTDSVIVATANKIDEADISGIVEQGTNALQEAASTVSDKVDSANIGEIVEQGTDIIQDVASSVGDKVDSLQDSNQQNAEQVDGSSNDSAQNGSADQVVQQLSVPVTLIITEPYQDKASAARILKLINKDSSLAGISLQTYHVGETDGHTIALTGMSKQEAYEQWEIFKRAMPAIALLNGPKEVD